MLETMIQLLPFIIGSALVPVQVMIAIFLLNNPNRGLIKAICLVGGMTAVRLLQGAVFGWVFAPGADEASGKGPAVLALQLMLGVLLLITAYKKWRDEGDPDDPPPKWMTLLDTITPLRALAAGAGLVLISGKSWAFTLSAIGVIDLAQLGRSTSIATFLLFLLLAQSLILLAILARLVAPKRAGVILGNVSTWLERNNRPIVVTVSLVFGLLFFWKGASGLLGW